MAKKSFFDWFETHAKTIQGISALVTLFIALAALIGVKVQIDAAARTQQEQSARDIYREFLNLSISKPEFADPDYCTIKGGAQETAYKNYVEYLLYTSEQMLFVSPEWESALSDHLSAHAGYLCGVPNWSAYPDNVRGLVGRLKGKICVQTVTDCGQ
jgi:hypothetical protein